jgi:macrodomain Ter protein organizer (MatP/YcbG family)
LLDGADQVDGEQAPAKGKAAAKKAKVRGRTIYLDDVLFERIMVAAHRRDRTISEFVSGLLDRHVPNHLAREEVPQPRPEQEG